MDEEHQTLVRFQTDMVGAPDPRMVLRRVRRGDRRQGNARVLSEVPQFRFGAGSRRIGYMVQFCALALFDLGLAGQDGGSGLFLSDIDAGHRI